MSRKNILITVEESDSSIGFYDLKTGSELKRIQTGFWPHEILLNKAQTIAFVTNFGVKDYDERIGKPGASISIIDIENMCEVDRLYTFNGKDEYLRFKAPHGLALSKDEKKLYVNVETEDQLLVFDLVTKKGSSISTFLKNEYNIDSFPDRFIDIPVGTHHMMFSKSGDTLYIVSGKNGVNELDVKSGRVLRSFYCNGAVRGLEYSNDGKELIASASNEICIVDQKTFKIKRKFTNLNARQILYSKQSPDGKYIIAPAVWEGQILIIDFITGEIKERINVGADPIHIMISPNQKSFFTTHGRSKFLTEIDLNTFKTIRNIPTKGGPNGIAWASTKVSVKPEKLTFGACIPLSGPTAAEGQDLRLGYQFWQENVNNAGGLLVDGKLYEIDLVFEDTQSVIDELSISKLTNKLIEEHKVQFMLGNYPSPPNLHAGKIANQHKVPYITASGAAGIIYEQGHDYVFGIMSSAKAFLEGTFQFLSQIDSPPKSVLFLSCVDPAALQDARTTASIADNEHGLEIVLPKNTENLDIDSEQPIIKFEHNQQDFSSIITALASVSVDVISITGHLSESVAFIEQASKQNINPKSFVFSVGPAIPEFSIRLKDKAINMIGTAMWSSVQESYGHDRFITPKDFEMAFFKRYSKKPSYLAAGAVACGNVYEEAFRRANSINGTDIILTLKQPDFIMESFYSKIEFNKNGLNSKRPLITIQLRKIDGNLVHIPLWPKSLANKYKIVYPFPGWDSN
ncbi:ABC transporter substrate-binding protein [uncultured Psychroserpens sp.]|uniref:ABC transporter substrate-binding protein n=1 Tax=uncultured Psychroserpens sp. TaxID=255436 RepID=UPI0026028883|nr:ABC transporter substrate-binding protein [uncultured Psychroserpens sp.]